jgi:hypothetical protein
VERDARLYSAEEGRLIALWIPSLQGLRQFRCLERPHTAVLRLSLQLY